jgi:hypothetical protein
MENSICMGKGNPLEVYHAKSNRIALCGSYPIWSIQVTALKNEGCRKAKFKFFFFV